MLLPRILTALVGLPIVIAAIYFGGIFFMVFVFAIIMACLYEYGLVLLKAKNVNLDYVEDERPYINRITSIMEVTGWQ